MDLTYDDIVRILMIDFEEYAPDGISRSKPVIGQENGQIVDCFFLYIYNLNTNEFSAPMSRLALDSYKKEIAYCFNSDEMPFGNFDHAQMFKVVSAYTIEQRLDADKKYPDCYIMVREFAFQESLSQDQLSVLSDYLNVFMTLVPENQISFYLNLSPPFFDWISKTLGPNHDHAKAIQID